MSEASYCFTYGSLVVRMSLVGKKPVSIPNGTDVVIKDNAIEVKGALGTLNAVFHKTLSVQVDDSRVLTVTRPDDKVQNVAMHGLWRSLINNMVVGVSEGFEKKLELIGTGYRVQQKGKNLELSLGFSHSVTVKPIGTNTLSSEGNIVSVKGVSKETVGEQAAQIRKLRKPNPYTGKGIKYVNETIQRKAGKRVGSGA